jgi:cytochrome d ubiquinol oxidase subunit II
MVETWFAIFWMMITIYIILDGRTLGAATLRLAVSSNGDERRQVVDAIGPIWSLYEVWLVGAGGVLLLAFPAALAVAFSGYYLALFLVLWLLILRGIAMEFGRHFDNPLWNSFWDVVLTASSGLLILLFGVALGNITRGVPLDEHGEFHMAFFTDFGVRGNVGLLDWYALSVGVFSLAALSAHGATFLAHRTTGPLRDRSRAIGKWLWLTALGTGIVVAIETHIVRPDLGTAFVSHLLSLAFLALAAAGAAAIVIGYRSGRDGFAFAGSCTLIAGVLAARAAAVFPVLLHSTLDPERSITAFQAATRHEGLAIGLAWFAVGAPLAGLWHFLAERSFRGKGGGGASEALISPARGESSSR